MFNDEDYFVEQYEEYLETVECEDDAMSFERFCEDHMQVLETRYLACFDFDEDEVHYA